MGERDGQQARAAATHEDAQVPVHQGAHAAKPASGPQADQMLGSILGYRATPPARAEHDFGEPIVGSDNNVEHIHAPFNLADTPATAEFSVSGEAFRLTSTSVMTLKPSRQMQGDDLAYVQHASPKIAFRPVRAGEARGALTIRISWPMEGRVETQTIALHGRARDLAQAPTDFGTGESSQETGTTATAKPPDAGASETTPTVSSETATKKDVDAVARNATSVAAGITNAANAASGLAEAQKDGVDIVKDEAAAYAKAIPKVSRSRWWDLAEMALNLTTGGLAGAFASRLLPKLLTTKVVDHIPGMGNIEMTLEPKISETMTATIRSALILAGQHAIKAALPSGGDAAPASEAASTGEHSTNARIDFFAEQREILRRQGHEYHAQVQHHAKQVLPLVSNRPENAHAILDSITNAFTEITPGAEQAQANAVAPAWATLVARLGLGQEAVRSAKDPAATRQATRMDTLRRPGHAGSAAGVLDVYVSSGKVVAAKVNGIAQEVADRFANMPLAQVPMPIRFIMGRPGEPRPTILTRDETGRVRVEGEIGGQTNEPDAIRTATELMERILSTSLNINIETDDTTGRGP